NVLGGVASFCRRCVPEPTGTCAPCPPGNVLDRDSGTCRPCPPGTYLRGHPADGTPACHPCGPGTRSNQLRSLCYNNCSLALVLRGHVLTYEFPGLGSGRTLASAGSFSAKGRPYRHLYSLRLCGHQGRKMATCSDNVTEARVPAGRDRDTARLVTSYVCQAILVPADVMGRKTAVTSQPVSLADRLLGVTTGSSLDGVTAPPELFPPGPPDLPDIVFFYRSNDMSQPCSSGRATTVRLRCDPLLPGTGTLAVPSKCPEGTCDGCTFHFLWVTGEGCPRCSPAHYRPIVGACVGGIQRTTFVWREPRLCRGGQRLPAPREGQCRSPELWLKGGIAAGTALALLLAGVATYFWRKNQRLEYKYSKLVMTAVAKDSELVAPDSCAIMEGEDAEDDLVFATKKSLFGKIKSLTSKRTPDGFDSVPLKTSSSSGGPEL
ncbi:UPF0577 protein KIAA1324 homolog, partial [Calypte anna]|uniref:UPF0577 protein KIAA1324 homolog n=1 Tax=Calypte anna TaxID=9244 RepID=UPI0011C3E6E1